MADVEGEDDVPELPTDEGVVDGGERVWGWPATAEQVQQRRGELAAFTAGVAEGVRYYEPDYYQCEEQPPAVVAVEGGFRHLRPQPGAVEAVWMTPGADVVAHAVELTFTDGRLLTLSWDDVHLDECLSMTAGSVIGWRLSAESDIAVWDASVWSRHWQGLLPAVLQGVEADFADSSSGWACHHVTFTFPTARVRVSISDVVDIDVGGQPVAGDDLVVRRV